MNDRFDHGLTQATPMLTRTETLETRNAAAWAATLGRMLPNLVVLLALAGLAWWGHRSGWKVPKFSALMGHPSVRAKDWCEAHSVPQSLCVECKPDLLPRGQAFGWCRKHGIAECPLDHPELAQVKGRPQLPRYDVAAALQLMDRPENNSKCRLHQRRIQFASAAAADKAGVDVEMVREAPMTEFVAASGEVVYDQTRAGPAVRARPGYGLAGGQERRRRGAGG